MFLLCGMQGLQLEVTFHRAFDVSKDLRWGLMACVGQH